MSRSAIAGGIVWIGLVAASRLQWARLNTIELLFLLGPLVIVPLGLELCVGFTQEDECGLPIRIVGWIQLPAAFCATASFWFQPGVAAAILALPWFGFGCLIAFGGLRMLIQGEFKSLKMVCLIVSFLYLPVGCAWLIASRLGLTPMGFQEPIVLLTAVHFHFAGFGAPLLALAAVSAIDRKGALQRRTFNVVAAGILAGPGLLAAGFVIGPSVKLAMALLVACSEIGLSLFFLAEIRAIRPRFAQMLVAISSASVFFAMVLAGVWAIGEFPLQPFVHLDEMARLHGTANSLGFILCGLLGWTISAHRAARLEGDPR
jgi:YndJ-like protein